MTEKIILGQIYNTTLTYLNGQFYINCSEDFPELDMVVKNYQVKIYGEVNPEFYDKAKTYQEYFNLLITAFVTKCGLELREEIREWTQLN